MIEVSTGAGDLTGELLEGRYLLGDVIGSGGMGAVYVAEDVRLERTVAVKVLRASHDPVSRSRMRSEAHLAAGILHPGVAQVFDFSEESATHPGTSFIVMEHVDGRSLAELLREQGPMSPHQVMSVVVQVAEALAAAHAAGVVHRDLKPANIMLTAAGRTVLVDFGIARSDDSEPLTATGALVGTVDYLSPEQAAGRTATPASDLYGLGVVAHHCLTGTSPFRRESQVATALAHLNDELPDLPPSVPSGVADLVARLTAKSPFDRPADAAVVAAEAAEVGADASIDVPPAPADVHRRTALHLGRTATTVAPVRHRSRRRTAVFSGVGLVTALLVFAGVDQLRAERLPVPDVVGLDVVSASTRITDDGMDVRRKIVDHPGSPAGQVVRQSPVGGTAQPESGRVVLVVASGKVEVGSDGIVGASFDDAEARLRRLGLVVSRVDVPRASDVGKVVSLDRTGRVPDGTTITLGVAVPMPVATSTSSAGSTGAGARTSSRSATSKKSASRGQSKGHAKGKAKGRKK